MSCTLIVRILVRKQQSSAAAATALHAAIECRTLYSARTNVFLLLSLQWMCIRECLCVLLYLFIHFSPLYLAPSISITSLHLSICCCCFAIPCWFTFIFPITSLCAVRRQWRRQRRQRRQRRRRWRFGYFVLD